MNFFRVILIGTMLLTQSFSHLKAQWQWQTPVPQGNDLNALVYEPLTGEFIAVGEYGVVVDYSDSLNAGYIQVNDFYSFHDIVRTENNKLLAVNEFGQVLSSSDQGATWSLIQEFWPLNLAGIAFPDSVTGYITGNYATILKTTDGGANWDTLSMNNTYQDGRTMVYFINADTGFVGYNMAESRLLRTTDGGATWDTTAFDENYIVSDIDFLNDTLGYLLLYHSSGYSQLKVTEDAGQNWVDIPLPVTGRAMRCLYADAEKRILAGAGGVLLYSDDDLNWDEMNMQPSLQWNDLVFADNNRGLVVGEGGSILETFDGGLSWTHQSRNRVYSYWDIAIADDTTGYLSGSTPAMILKSSDAGESWEVVNDSQIQYAKYALHFVNRDTGFAAGNIGIIQRTFDGGENWDTTDMEVSVFRSLDFYNALTGLAGGDSANRVNGVIARTVNGGETWEKVFLDYPVNEVFMPGDSIGYAIGGSSSFGPGIAWKTHDQGESWTQFPDIFGRQLLTGFFFNTDTGIIVDASGLMYRTENGGTSWDTLYNAGGAQFTQLHFLDNSRGYATAAGGYIIYTQDGGESWFRQDTRTPNDMQCIAFFDEEHGIAAGMYGSILSTANGGVVCPTALFELSDTAFCTGDQVQVTNMTQGFNIYTWWAGDSLLTEQNGGSSFWLTLDNELSGPLAFRLVANNSGCTDTLEQVVNIYPVPEAVVEYMIDEGGILMAYHTDSVHATDWYWGLEGEFAEDGPYAEFDLNPYADQASVSLYMSSWNALNCFSDTLFTIVLPPHVGVGVNEQAVARLYPNPTTGKLNIEASDYPLKLAIYNTQGRLLGEYLLTAQFSTLDLQTFPEGVYLIRTGTQMQILVKHP